MSRFLFTIAIALLANSAFAAERAPNVVVILADDMGYGDLGCYGHKSIRTPKIDKLAAEGIRFTDFYVTHPYCTPTRAALLTGRHPIRTGMTRVLWPHSKDGLDAEEVTLAELFKKQKYATALFGKWHLGSLPEHFPTKHGFDEWFGMPWPNDQDDKHFLTKKNKWDWGPLRLYRNDKLVEKPAKQETLTERYFGEAIRFITANKTKPFFVFIPTSMPHLWLAASDNFKGKSKHGLYGDTIEEIDFYVGELMSTLKKLELDQNTVVVFFSDNGPVTSHQQLDPKDPKGSAGVLKLGKGTTWEGGIRVPCIVRWGGQIKPGRIEKRPVVVMDLFTTLASVAGCELPKNVKLDGRDLTPLLKLTGPVPEADIFFYARENLQAVRSGKWKLKLPMKGMPKAPDPNKQKDTPLWLTDLEADPGEKTNLAEKFPDKVKELEEMMEKWKKDLGAVPKPKV